ncbi:hypothetical protein [Streptomyces zagrosensis]|uniref:Alpha/beta hydrolase n=1 Tax=Streptomyces zagrosensis TaxID=1042984 RepID=A0A7W9Q8U5_9ACTN|nr:hypothetical protein [Streptomyces zagrosensis]MBB5935734.1 hypothetical protein [Streptomyces zagrosensis]
MTATRNSRRHPRTPGVAGHQADAAHQQADAARLPAVAVRLPAVAVRRSAGFVRQLAAEPRRPTRARRRMPPLDPAAFTTVDLDEDGWLLAPDTGEPVPADRLTDHLATWLRPPPWATDIVVYVHGWRTGDRAAVRNAQRLLALCHQQRSHRPHLYPRLYAAGCAPWAPWTVVVRWPSSSRISYNGYYAIRRRAHAMSAPGKGYAPHVLGHLLGYLDAERGDPRADTLVTSSGQYLHLVGHSFGGRFLCEAVRWAATAGDTLTWSIATHPSRPFTIDSLTAFQMAAPTNAFDGTFRALRPDVCGHQVPLGGPMVFTHSRHDRATGYCHLHAEHLPGIGHSGMRLSPARGDLAPNDVWHTRLLRADTPYPRACLDHPFVNIDASWRYRNTRLNPIGAHSDYFHPESAHLLLSLAEWSRPE